MRMRIGVKQKGLIQMKNGNYEIKFSKKAIKDKKNLKNAGLDKIAINILTRINRQHRIVYKVDEGKKKKY